LLTVPALPFFSLTDRRQVCTQVSVYPLVAVAVLVRVCNCGGVAGSGRFIAGGLAGEMSRRLAWRRSPGEEVLFLAAVF